MTHWEYKVVRISERASAEEEAEILGELGEEGWEAYAVREAGVAYGVENVHYLKRPIEGCRRKP